MTDTVVQHHEGAGRPRDDGMDEVGTHGYSYVVGLSTWKRYRGPGADFSTAGWNHRSLGVCLMGDRNKYPVTDTDLQFLREVAADARSRGELDDIPGVFAHRQMPPPNATVCAGDNVGPAIPAKGLAGNDLEWMAIVGCYHKEAPPPMPATTPEFWPAVDDIACVDTFGSGKYIVMVQSDGHVYCPKGGYAGGPYDDHTGKPKPYWVLTSGEPRAAATVTGSAHGYIITATTGETYTYPD